MVAELPYKVLICPLRATHGLVSCSRMLENDELKFKPGKNGRPTVTHSRSIHKMYLLSKNLHLFFQKSQTEKKGEKK